MPMNAGLSVEEYRQRPFARTGISSGDLDWEKLGIGSCHTLSHTVSYHYSGFASEEQGMVRPNPLARYEMPTDVVQVRFLGNNRILSQKGKVRRWKKC